jgi:glycerate 2-kinase
MQPSTEANYRQLLIDSYLAAVAAADPLKIVAGFLPSYDRIKKFKKTTVIGAGKASASMAMAVENYWPSDCKLDGLVVTRYGHSLPCQRIQVIEAGHPVPDDAGAVAAQTIYDLAANASEDELLLVLISGGGSSLLSLPADDVPMADLKALTSQLLACGAPIQDMNVVRKHLSRIQGGRLAQVCKATVIALVISDVVGDDLSAIASGPTVPDPSTFADAQGILKKFNVNPPQTIQSRLQRGADGQIPETPKAGDACFARCENHLIATAKASLAAAGKVFETAGVSTLVLGDDIEGEAREVGRGFALQVPKYIVQQAQTGKPLAIISGGECTVTLLPQLAGSAKPRGGRCSEFLLGFVNAVDELHGLMRDRIYGLAADTDGVDGSETNAGALMTPQTFSKAKELGLPSADYLARNDAYGYFAATNDLVTVGPTLTNVNDYRVILLV